MGAGLIPEVACAVLCLVAQSCPTLCDPVDCSLPGSSIHGISQARITGMGSHFLFQGIFSTQGSNWPLLHWQEDSLPAELLGKPSVIKTF